MSAYWDVYLYMTLTILFQVNCLFLQASRLMKTLQKKLKTLLWKHWKYVQYLPAKPAKVCVVNVTDVTWPQDVWCKPVKL